MQFETSSGQARNDIKNDLLDTNSTEKSSFVKSRAIESFIMCKS